MSERSEISIHEIKVFLALKSATTWLTNREIGAAVNGVANRTVRAHVLKLVKLGLVDQAELFPAHRYRLSDLATKRNRTYLQRLEQAIAVIGQSL